MLPTIKPTYDLLDNLNARSEGAWAVYRTFCDQQNEAWDAKEYARYNALSDTLSDVAKVALGFEQAAHALYDAWDVILDEKYAK